MGKKGPEKPVIGWREWVALPDLGIRAIKVKVDTGARTSALHVFDVRRVEGEGLVRFRVHPRQRDSNLAVEARAPLRGRRRIRSSTGTEQDRLVIRTRVELAGQTWPIEVTLAERGTMGFRMTLGREAVRGRFRIDPGRSFLAGRPAAAISSRGIAAGEIRKPRGGTAGGPGVGDAE
ncbi:MAG: ATP-dependent zinc protease [Acidobacteria bacterium]|nr:ATP-dependent zinc protease [Acidobacteriota bacterium]